MTWNGFYSLQNFDEDTLKQIFRDALEVSHASHIDILGRSMGRIPWLDGECTVKEYIEKYVNKDSHNVFIDRVVYNKGMFDSDSCEIGSSYGNKYLFIYVSRKHMEELIKKYKIKKL